jgi:thioredoxin reductase (NADPH)
MQVDRDIIIIGGGPSGLAAAQYAARANLRTLVLEELAVGGTCLIIDRLENYPGFPEPVSGFELSQRMEEQTLKFGAQVQSDSVSRVRKKGHLFEVETTGGTLTAHTVIVATGAKHRTLDIPGEKEFTGRGVSYCATCDGPFFRDKRILVVGGGDAAADEASFLANLSEDVVMVHRRGRFRAQKALADRVLRNPHIQVRFNTELREIKGDGKVERVRLYRNEEESFYEEDMNAVFIFVGSTPRTAIVPEVELDEGGYILTDQRMETNIKGLFAIGDVRSTPFRQLVVGAGEGAIAAHTAAQYIDEMKGEAYEKEAIA